MRSSSSRCALALAAWLTAAWLRAQEPAQPPTLPEIPETTVVGSAEGTLAAGALGPAPNQPPEVITPTQTLTPAGQSGSSVTVITREQIEQAQRTYVLDVLRYVPGLDVVQTGPPGGFTSIFLRGGNSQHTKVLLDGVPLNDPSNAGRSFDFSTLTVDNIEQIDIVRGPQSLLYGSDAIGGVVNIITRKGQGPLRVRGGLMAGSYGTTQERFHLSGGTNHYHYS